MIVSSHKVLGKNILTVDCELTKFLTPRSITALIFINFMTFKAVRGGVQKFFYLLSQKLIIKKYVEKKIII